MTETLMPSKPSLWRRVTAGYAKLLEILLGACVGILVIHGLRRSCGSGASMRQG
ncbi:MAG: hypothetical protein ABIL01_20485 [Pseudomonadota bacterium]